MGTQPVTGADHMRAECDEGEPGEDTQRGKRVAHHVLEPQWQHLFLVPFACSPTGRAHAWNRVLTVTIIVRISPGTNSHRCTYRPRWHFN
jgi:hypothetical protein